MIMYCEYIFNLILEVRYFCLCVYVVMLNFYFWFFFYYVVVSLDGVLLVYRDLDSIFDVEVLLFLLYVIFGFIMFLRKYVFIRFFIVLGKNILNIRL